MKKKEKMLVALIEREMSEETKNYEASLKDSLRERVNALNTTDVLVINRVFRVNIDPIGPEYDFTKQECVPAPVEKYRKAIIDAVKRQMAFRWAKKKAAEIGLHYWPALLPSQYGKGKVDPLAFVAAEKALLSHGNKPWGTREGHGGWDSCGHWGVSPQQVAACWLVSGCKDSKKFRFLVRTGSDVNNDGLGAHKLKGLSLRQLRDLLRGQRWINTHCNRSCGVFSTKAAIALGRISPAARKAAIEGLLERGVVKDDGWGQYSTDVWNTGRKIRIRDLNWSAVKALQTMSKSEVCSRYLRGRFAWTYLQGVSAPKGLEKISPVGWSKDQSGTWSSRTVTFRDFSVWAPEGYSFGLDDNGLKLFEVAHPEEDYHFNEAEARGEHWYGRQSLLDRLLYNANQRREAREWETRQAEEATEAEARRRESDRAFAMMMDNLHLICVSRFDSYRAGNCAVGTAGFAERSGIDQRRLVRADILLRLSEKAGNHDRVMNTIRVAWERETLVMI